MEKIDEQPTDTAEQIAEVKYFLYAFKEYYSLFKYRRILDFNSSLSRKQMKKPNLSYTKELTQLTASPVHYKP